MGPPEPRVALLGAGTGIVAEALGHLLSDSGNTVLGAYASCEQLDADCGEGPRPELVVVDVEGSPIGAQSLVRLRRADPEVRIVLLCEEISPTLARRVLTDAVDGVVLKSDGAAQLCDTVAHALAGRAVLPPGWDAVVRGASLPPLPPMSMREREVLELAAAGLSNAEIAERLMISRSTVKFHLRGAYGRLGVGNRVEAAQVLRGQRPPPA